MKKFLLTRKSFSLLFCSLNLLVSFISGKNLGQKKVSNKKRDLVSFFAKPENTYFKKPALAFFVIAFLFLIGGQQRSFGQTSVQNFGTGTGSNTSQTGSTALLPNPTSGTTYARAGATAPNAPVNLANTSNPLGTTGSFVRAVASSTASVTKVSPIVSYTTGLEFYTSMKVLFGDVSAGTTATSGVWTFYQGAGVNYSDNSDAGTTQVFTGLRFTYGASGALSLTYNNNGTYNSTSLTTSAFTQGTVYTIEIVGNNKTSGTISYTYNGGAQTVAVQKFDLYINGTLVGNDLTKGTLAANTSINATTLTGVSSTSNVANIFLDDVTVYNAVPATIGTAPTTPSLAITGTTGHGSVCPSTSATPITYTITNSGTAASGVTVTSSDAQFVVSGLSSTSIAGSGGTATYVVTFTPTSAGAKTATITVASTTSGSNSPTSSLTGTGTTAVTQTVTSTAATLVAGTTASINGNVTALGVCPSTTEKGFVYSLTSANSDPLVAGTGVTKTAVSGLSTGAFTLALTGLTQGTGYSFKSYVYNGTTYTYGAVTTFTTTTPPANDLCANATTLTVNAVTSAGTMVLSTNTANSLTYSSTSNDVWYKFTPLNTGSHVITLTFTAATNRDIDFDVFTSASCPTTGVANFTAHGTGTTETVSNTFTFGTTYYIRAIDFGSANGDAFTIGITGPAAASITGTATAAAFTTTYGTASASQSFSVSGSGLTANLVATAPTGFEVSSDGITYGATATFTQTTGSASGTLSIRLKATAAVTGSYNSLNIVLSSTGATSVNITTAASGNTVTAKALTITADNRTKAYNTSLVLGTLAFSTNGLANSETVGAVTLSASGAASTATTPVGTYPITATAATGGTFTASNYTISYVDGVLTITQASQTITALTTPVTKTYGGATYSIATTASSGLVVTYSSSNSTVASVASEGTVTIHLPGTATLSAAQGGDTNYTAATNVTQALTVNPKNLTITGLTANNKVYDGNTDATVIGTASLVGVVSGDEANVSLLGTSTATFVSSAVGTGIQVNVIGYSLNGTASSYYTLTQPTLAADIIATTPTIFTSGTLSAVNTTYGTASSATTFNVSAQSLTEGVLITPPAGFEVSSDNSTFATAVTVGTTGNLASTPIYVRLAAATAVGTYSGNVTLASSGATSLTVATVSSAVSQKPLTITGLTGVGKTYDGSAVASVTGTASLVGVVGSDNVSLSGTPSFAFANADAGVNKPITVLGYTLNGTAAGNYSVSQPTGLIATIGKAASTISVTGSSSFTYNAAAQGPNTSSVTGSTGAISYSYNGVSPTVYGPSATRPTNAGSYTAASTVAADTNYETATSANFSFTIAKANQTITLASTDSRTTATTTYTLTLNSSAGLAITYTSSNSGVVTISGNTVTIVGAGTTTITATQAGDGNFNAATTATQTLTVIQAPIVLAGWDLFGVLSGTTLTTYTATTFNAGLVSTSGANNITRGATAAYSGANNSFRTAGFQNNGIATTNTDYFQTTLTATTSKSISLSAINANFSGTATYTVSPGVSSQFAYSTDGTTFTLIGSPTVTIGTPASLSIDVSGISALQNVAAGTTITLRYYASGQTTTGGWGFTSTASGTNGLAISGFVNQLATPTITLANATKTYGDVGFTMIASSDSSGAITYTSGTTTVATIDNSGNVTIKGFGSTVITANQTATSTFTSGSITATLTVNKATGLTITANGVSKTYGATLSNGSSTAFGVSGLQYTDSLGTSPTVTVTYGTGGAATDSATLSTVSPAVYSGTAVPSSLTAGSGATYNSNNYNAPSYISGDITVNKANQSITFAGTDSKVYGAADYAPGATSATSGTNALTYSTNGTTVATIVSGNIHIVGVGIAVVTAAQAGDANYNAATSATQTLTVSAKGLTISGLSASSKNYDGNTDATVTGIPSLVGVVGSDDVSLLGTAVGTFASSAVGTGIAVTVTGYSLNGTSAGNYTLTQPTLSADIIANTPTLFTSGTLAAVNTTYGSASTTPTSFNVSAQSLTDVITVAAPSGFEVSLSSGSGYATSITLGGAGNVSSTPIYVRLAATTGAGTYSGNITLNSTGATEVTIATASSIVAPKGLTISGLTGVDKTYDTTTTATVSGTATLNGIVGTDDVTVNSSTVTYNFATATTGTNKPITALGFSLNGTAAGNYTVAQPTGITANITKAASSISVTGSSSFIYNGTAQGPNTSSVTGSTGAISYSYNGVSPTVYGPSTTRPTNAGSYKVNATVVSDANYASASSADFNFTIGKAEQTITGLATTDSKTTGIAPYNLTATAPGGTIVYTSSNTAVATISGSTVTIVGVGQTTITADQAGNSNYNAAQVQQILTVTLPACASVAGTTSYNFGASTPFTASPTSTQSNVTASAVTQGNSNGASTLLSATSPSTGYTGASGTGNAGIAAVNGAFSLTASAYFAFTVTPASGYNFTLTGISFGSRSTSSAPQAYAVRSSLDNYATDIATGTLVNNSVYALKTNTVSVTGNGNANPVTFRIYGYGGTTTAGLNTVNWRIDDLALSISTSNAPSASTVGGNQSVCGLTSNALGGNTPGVGTGTWSQVSGPGTSTYSAVNSGTSTVTATVVGTYVYRWSITNGCATTNTADVTVVYNAATSNTTTATACDTYTWSVNGQAYTTTGIRSVVTGCHTEVLDLTINSSTTNTTTISACDTYTWSVNGTTYTESGTHTVTGTNAAGCTDTKTLVLTITPSSIHTTTHTACDSYTWNSVTYTESGIYTGPTANCVTEKLDLTITPSSTTEYTQSACDSYTWSLNGQTYSASGNYNFVTGCHTDILHLTITPSSIHTTTVSVCDTYTWSVNGATYTTSGLYTGTTTNCVTEKLNLTITPSTTTEYTQSACDTYTWSINGQTYTTSGDYSLVSGCHTDVLHLTVTPSSTHTVEVTACDSYTWSVTGLTYTDSDEYSATNGCVTETLLLTINNSTSSSQSVTACDTYTWSVNGTTYTTSGTYTVTGTNAAGCTDTKTLNLTINNSTSSSQSATACDTYTWSVTGQTYTTSGMYTATGTNAAGCTDTKTLNLTINNSTSSSQSAIACDSYTWSVNGTTYTASGTYTATSTNAAGCTDTKTLVLTINNSTSSSQSATACNSYTWSVTGQTYTTSGTYTATGTNAAGCTDTKTLNLTINNSTSSSESVTACDSYTWSVNGTTYTTSGTYTHGSTNASGCSHTQTLVLTINNSTSSSQSVTACDTYTWSVNATTYTTSGTYTSTSTNAAGCPDTKTLVLTINPIVNNTTTATACDSYTWSANGQTYTASGNFSVTTGCNTEYLVLTINNSSSHTTTVSACGSYTWSAPLGNGNTYATSQTGITNTSTNASGCTHTETLNLTIVNESITSQPLPPFICNTVGSTTSVSVSTNAAVSGYQWQMRVVTTAALNPVWGNVVNNTIYSGVDTATLGITRGASAFVAGTQYRVLVTGACGVLTSNAVALTVILSVKAGTITSPTSVCLGGSITFTLSGYAGTSLQWQSALNSTSTFTNIAGATSDVLTLTGATAGMNKSYRAVVTSNCGTTTTATTAIKTITVSPTTVAGSITGGGTVCSSGSGTVKLVGNVGTLQWEYSFDGVTYVNAPKAASVPLDNPFSTTSTSTTGASYVVTNITQNVYFRARVMSGACSALYASPVQFTIGTSAFVGTASAAATGPICTATGTTLSLAGTTVGVITWQKKTPIATTWTNIANSNVPSISTGNLTVTTMYRASVTIGSCSTVTSNEVTVSIVAAPLSKTVTSNATTPSGASSVLALCRSFNVAKTLTIGAGYNGAIQWQRSTTTSTTGFANILGATSQSYTINEASVGVNYYRAVFTNSCGAVANGIAVTLWYKDCSAKAATSDAGITASFNVVAYPNPYSETFNLSLTTASEAKVGIVVYDMTGRLIER
ncbi:YDG domain-containing protein, partial [Flavobacterium sp.]|uniref:YDG domain-containing protein n=1 Tax=Flavobacterium sp. TaxID=239 RepID=UPI0025F73D62